MSRVFEDKVLGGLYVFGCNPLQWVILVGPFIGHDNAIDFNFEEEAVAHSPAAGNANRHIVFHCDKGDAFICARFSAKEINEDALFAGVLVGDEAEARTGGGN